MTEAGRLRAQRALWRRRLLAAAAVAILHVALFWVVAGDWGAHRAPAMAPTLVVTLERPLTERREEAPRQTARTPARPTAVPPPPFPAITLPEGTIPAPPARAAPRPAAPLPGAPPAVALNLGCMGSRERMTPAQRRACDEQRLNLAAPNRLRLPDKLPPTALDREFAAAWTRRRQNDPRPKAARPTNCQLANITNCEPEDSTLVLFDGHGTGTAQVLKRQITGEKLPEKPPAKAASVFGREEITFTPAPMR